MTTVDTSQSLTIFPQAAGLQAIGVSLLTAVLGGIGIWLGLEQDQWPLSVLTGWLLPLGLWMTWFYARRHRAGNPDPALTLSPEGLRLMTGTTGLIRWGQVNGIGSAQIGGNRALVINVDEAAMAQLDQSRFTKTTRKFDAALGVHALIFFQTQVEIPLHELADMIHDYSIAHGGSALQPNRTP